MREGREWATKGAGTGDPGASGTAESPDLGRLLEHLPGVVYRCHLDEHWTMEFLSAACRTVTGYAPEALIGNRELSFADLILPLDRQRVWDEVQAAVKDDRPFILTYRIRTAEGKVKWVWEHGCAVRGPGGRTERLEGYITDITHQKHLEEQLQHAQKMELLGQLAGGVAHDFNNLLTMIMAFTAAACRSLPHDHRALQDLEEVLGAAERAAALTRQLLAFARPAPQAPRPVDVNELVVATLKGVRRILGEDIEVVTLLGEDLWPVELDPSHFSQILINLAANARDAMHGGGTLTIETRNVSLASDNKMRLVPGDYVHLSVSDTGPGMDEATRELVFEPFFTTKEPGRGTGLGLAVSQRIVREARGAITVESAPGRGATFVIHLPRSTGAAVPTGASRREATPLRGRETILLVEDEPRMRRALRRALEGQGYQVLEADDGETALRLARDHDGRIDLLLSDVIMPHMRGPELQKRLAAEAPDMKVLFMSGYIDKEDLAELRKSGPAFLAKPFLPDELFETIRQVLDG